MSKDNNNDSVTGASATPEISTDGDVAAAADVTGSLNSPGNAPDSAQESTIPLAVEDYDSLPLQKPQEGAWRHRLLVLLFACLVFLPNLGSFGLWDPWETHYGEVTRDMVEHNRGISTYWGSPTQVGTKKQGKWFWSKPIYIFWSEKLFIHAIGLSEWAVRLPIALLAIFAVFFVFWAFNEAVDRRAAWWAAVILATCPMFFFIARQAQTDMPFVGTLTIALSFLMLALFRPPQEIPHKRFLRSTIWLGVFFLITAVPQWLTVAAGVPRNRGVVQQMQQIWGSFGGSLIANGFVHLLLYLALGAAVFVSIFISLRRHHTKHGEFTPHFRDRMTRSYHLLYFYIFAAHATMAKGLLGFMLPGAIIFFFLLASRRWRLLKRMELLRGLPLFLAVGMPWYVAMFVNHHRGFYDRFIIHDHFNRLGSGVHQIDSGTFEHFVKWLGLGMFPWVVFVPALFALIGYGIKQRRDRALVLFLFLWFFVSYTLFTLSSTKFHHYIFPALPGLAMLIALLLRQIEEKRGWRVQAILLSAIGMLAVVSRNLLLDVQSFRKLFTYQYDRKMPDLLPIGSEWADAMPMFAAKTNGVLKAFLKFDLFRYETFIAWVVPIICGAALLAWLVYASLKEDSLLRRVGKYGFSAGAVLLALWGLNYYMPMLSPHWSQKYLFDRYYEECTRVEPNDRVKRNFTPLAAHTPLTRWIPRVTNARGKQICKEKIVGWLLTWRGETFYSHNTLYKLDADQLYDFLTAHNGPKTFYVFGVYGGVNGIKGHLSTALRKAKQHFPAQFKHVNRFQVDLLFRESNFFELGVATPK